MRQLEKQLKYCLIQTGGILISLITILWMPWKLRIMLAKLVYKITYVNPKTNPTYMNFIEESNAKYQMGKRKKDSYKNIQLTREKYEQQ